MRLHRRIETDLAQTSSKVMRGLVAEILMKAPRRY